MTLINNNCLVMTKIKQIKFMVYNLENYYKILELN